jgi:phage terminase large subunit-like protein
MRKEVADFLATLSDAQCAELLADWSLWARPDQLTPKGNWKSWLILAGRGWGKTRTGAEQVHAWARSGKVRIALVGRTYSDTREVMVEGESGILATAKPGEVSWHPARGILRWKATGAVAKIYTADKPDQLRGPQHHYGWGDEVATWEHHNGYHALDQLQMGLRLGRNPQAIFTTTPRPKKEIREMLVDPDTHVTRGRTLDNRSNLAPEFVDKMLRRYAGTRTGRQELDGEVLEDVAGALWTMATIEAHRVDVVPCDLSRIVVAVDPAGTSHEESDETGILVVGRGVDGRAYVLEDLSGRHHVSEWPRIVIAAFDKWRADAVVAETNMGHDLIKHTLRTVRRSLPVAEVVASRGKVTRADPVASEYIQGTVSHVGAELTRLEDQLTTWIPGRKSPDRLDALVYGLTYLGFGGESETVWSEIENHATRSNTLNDVLHVRRRGY